MALTNHGRPNPNGDLLRSELDKSKGIFCGCAPRTRLILAIAGVFFLGFTVIMVIVGFKVLAPNFVKGRIAATSLSFSQLIIHAPPSSSVAAGAVAGAGGVFDIEVAAILSGLSPVGGTLNSFQATLSYKGSPVGTFTMPSLPAAANKANALSFRATVTSHLGKPLTVHYRDNTMKKDTRVAGFRLGAWNEGGAGVTVAELG
jgi:hypothetical protein